MEQIKEDERYCKGQTNNLKELKMTGKGRRYYRRKEQVQGKKKTKIVRKPTTNREGGKKVHGQ